MHHNRLFPLTNVFETEHFPHARTLRTSFLYKIKDTYNAIAGKIPGFTSNYHLGIFDYLTLFIPLGLFFLTDFCDFSPKYEFLSVYLRISLLFISILLLIPRVVFSAVATILLLPIIAIVHVISQIVAGQSHTEALSLLGKKNHEEISLNDYLTGCNINIEKLEVIIIKHPENDSSSYDLMFREKLSRVSSDAENNTRYLNRNDPFYVRIIREEETNIFKQSKNIHALFKLNVGNIFGNNNEESKLHYIQDILSI